MYKGAVGKIMARKFAGHVDLASSRSTLG